MTIRNGDMPAMPLPNDASGRPYVVDDYDMQNKNLAHGLTKREQFAMAAMQGLAASGKWHETKLSVQAVKMADALLAELDKDGGE